MFLSNWLVFKIVLAAVTGLVDYPLAADVLLVYDNANKLYLEGNSIDYVSNVVLYKGETSYTLGTGDILNKTTTTAYEVVLPSSSVHGTFGINQDATRYVHQYPEASGYQNGKFQVYSGTPSDGYTEYGSEIQPFNGDEIILCSMSADGKYILVTNYNGGFADGYKMYKDNGSEYVYHSSYACIGSSTNNDTGYKPAFVPSNNNFVITGTGGGSNSDDFYFKLYVYDPLTETWTGKTTVYSLNAPTGDAQRGLFGKLFTYDGKYLMMSDNGTPTRGEVYEVDWDANTMVNVWYTTEGSDGDGAGGAISHDNRYVVLARHDGNPYRVYENMSGDWSTVENVTSQFDLTGSGTGTIFGGYGIEFSGYSSENTTPLYIGQVSYHGDGKFRLENWAKRSPYEMYITQPGTYRADLQICGIDYKTNTVEVTGTPSDIEVFKEPETNFSTSNALFSQNGFYTASGSSDATYLLIHPTSTSITVYKGTPDNGYTSYYTDSTNVNINPATMSHDGLYIVKRSSANTIDLYKHNTSTQTYVKTSGKFSTPYDVYKIGFLPNSYDFGYTVTNGSNESVLYLHKYNSGDTWDTPTSINLTSIYSLSTSANYGRYGISFSKKDTNGNCFLAFADSFASSNELYILNVNWNTMSTSLIRSITTTVSYSWTVSFTRDGVYLWIAQSSGATRQMFKSTDNWVSYEDVTSSFTNSQYLGSHTTTFLKEYVIGAHYENPVSGIEDVIRLYKWQDLISPTLTFDGYNQLSLTNTPTYTSSKLTYGSNVYDIGTLTSDITIEKPGEYASLTFDTSSNVAYFSNATVGAMGTTLADYVVDTTIYGTVQSGQTHQIGQGGFGNNTILNADGTRLLITDPLNYPSGRGRAYIYHLENGSWVLKQTWDNPNNTGQRFADGACMNEDGTRIFLMHNASEKVYTYEYTNGAWPTDNTGTHVITVGTNIGAEYEGLACNKAGDVLLMGHGNANTAYIYRRASATSWSQDSGGSFTKGRGVAMNGDGTRAFIGNSTDGTVHMTEWNGSTWSSLTQIIDESYSNWPCTMMSDSVGETLVIVSGNGDSSSGNSGIYERDSGTGLWSRAQGVNADTEIYGMRLPSISYDGTMVLVGSFRYDSSKGRAQLWQKSNGAWTLKKEYLNPDTSPASSDQFGAGCGIARTTKDKFVIGMEGDDTAGTDYGSVYVYNNTIPDFISFDTYNKLSLSGLTNPTSKIHVLPTGAETTTVYDIGTATNIYIESEGTYTAEMKGSDGFALVSNVVGTGQISEPPVYSSATPTLVDPIDITDGIWSSGNYEHYQTHSTYYLYALSLDDDDSDRFIKYDWVNLVWSDQDQSGTYSTFGTSATDTTATARSITNPTHIYLMAGSQLHATMVNPYYQVPNYSPSLTHDTYNKLSIENITPTASTLRLGSNTYDIGTATDIYIEDTGTYEIETKDSNTFAFASNTATYQVHPNTAYSNYRSIGGISAASTSLHNENITTTYSVTMWAKSASATYIVRTANSDTNASGNNTHGIFGINSSGEFSIPSWTSGDSISVSFSGTPDYRDEWHFYGFEFNDTTIKVHIDGATPITGSTGYSGQTHNRMRFDNPNAFTDGTRLAEFAVYNRALSDAEFVSIYNNGLPNGPDNVSGGRVSWFKCLSGAMGTNSGTGGDFDASFTEDTDVPSAWLDPTPSLTHDTYNKLSIENITPTASTLRLGSNTYDIGTATDIYIEDTGTYEIETKDANTFALVSNVVDTVTQVGAYDSSATPTLVDPIDITDGIWSSLTYQWYQTHSTYYLYKLSGDPNDSDRFIKYDWVNLVWSDQDQSGTYSTFGTSATDTTATARSITNPTHIYLMAGSQLHATMVNPYYQVPNYSPSLTHDTYNKLSIENITPTASTLRLGSNTYDIGTATDIYIEDTGTYEIETKDANTFAFASNTATYQVHPNTAYSNYRSIGGISAASTSLHNENITTTYSVTMWAKSASATYIVRTANSDTNASGNNTHGIFGINSSGEFSIPSWTSGDSISVSFSGTPDYRDEWHFYGFEFNDTTIKVHIDGATPITGSTGYSGQTHNRMRFDNPNAFTDGTRLAEFAVYNRALSDAEFVSIYNNGLPNGPDNVSSGRVSWFKCLSGAMGTNSGTGGDFDASFTEDTDVPSAWLDPTPSLTHDTYNKLSIENITPTASTLRLGSNTYDIGTATDIYIEDTGTYEIETKDANTFALVSNVVDTVTQVGAYDSSATPTLVDPIDITDGIWSSLTYQWYQTHSTYYLYKLSGDPNDSDRFIKYDWVNLVWSDQDQSGTYSTFGTSATDTTATARSITNPTHIYLMAGSQLHATMVNPYYQVPNYSPSLTHDTYNKLSIENITPTASTLRLGSNTYDIGTATDIYIEDTGTYEIETKDANTFAFASNTATYQVHPNTAYSNYRS